PIPSLGPQLFSSGLSQPIEARPAVIFRGAPLGCDRAFLLQLQQYGIESALIHRQQIAADLLDAPGDSVAVQWPQDVESLEDHQCERALQDVEFLFHSAAILVSNSKHGT